MSVPTDSQPVSPSMLGSASGARRVPRAIDHERDLALIARVARGEVEASRELATRMAPRVERVARALMGGSLDARDAALHALIELLRSHALFRGTQRLERWGERVAALSVVRFARAVLRRNGAAHADSRPTPPDPGRAARTFEQYLGMLSEASRQLLLLRHALDFTVAELADALQYSPHGAREKLLAARREFRALVRRRESQLPAGANSSAGIGHGAQRWCALRDREAVGEPLLPEELDELALLEAREPEVWAFVAQMRALERYFDARAEGGAPIDGTLVESAVEALKVSSPTVRTRALVDVRDPDTLGDGEGGNWIAVVAWAISAALAAATALALYWQQPSSASEPVLHANEVSSGSVVAPVAVAPPRPTVEALPSARTAMRGARLRRAGKLLPEGSVLGQGDTLEAIEKVGCLELAPAYEACLAPGSALTMSQLQAGARELSLVRGRVVARGHEVQDTTLVLRALEVELKIQRGAVALERLHDGTVVRARALRGDVELKTARETRRFAEGQGAQVRVADGSTWVAVAPPALLQRDWEVLAVGLHATSALPPQPAAAEASRAAPRTKDVREPGVEERQDPEPAAANAPTEPAGSDLESASTAEPTDVPTQAPEPPAP